MELGLLMFPSPGGTARMAEMLEGLGFDHIVFADTQNLTPEVHGQLMLAARDTARIQLGTGVTNPVSRDAAVTASSMMALQLESGGRALLGIGRGDSSMAKIGRRPADLQTFERYIEQVQAYMRGEVVIREGGEESRLEWIEGLEITKPPLEVAATGPRVIEIAARHADQICFALGARPERLVPAIARAREAAERAGRDPDSLRFGAYVNCVIDDDVAAARDAIRGGLSVFAHFSGFRGMDLDALPEPMRSAAAHLRDHYDMADHARATGANAQALEDAFVEWFGIVGPAEKARERFLELGEVGLDLVRVVPGSRDMPPGMGLSSMQRLASDVRPALRA